MKQTSLIQSWTRAQNPSACNFRQFDSFVKSTTPDSRIAAPSKSTVVEDEDQLLLECLDNYTTNHNDDCIKPESRFNQTEEIIKALHERPPVQYRPTDNDADHLEGFDMGSGQTWSYPLNVNLRDYQFRITEQCLYKNTLVCLPTGLGKTFIAAVVIYNYLRWYPTGKAVFMAPTRPLVSQQLNACRQLTNLAAHHVTELTGSIAPTKRRQLWSDSRVLFLTPQVLVNDLNGNICPAQTIRLLVFDEAHKATGNHAYCQVIRSITNEPYAHRQFRIIALTATPASDIQGVQAVIANLLISHLELRTDACADIQRYTQHRQLESIVVPLGPELMRYRKQLVGCVTDPLDRLCQRGAIRPCMGDLRPDRLAKYTVIKARQGWNENPLSLQLTSTESSMLQVDFSVLTCLLHAIELLDQHGLRPLYQYLFGVLNGSRMNASTRAGLIRLPGLEQLWTDLSERFQAVNFQSTQTPFLGGHPKLDKLKELIVKHFHSAQSPGETRVIVFSQFRDSVEEIMHMLKQLRPLIRPASFMGHSSNVNRSPGLSEETSGQPSPIMMKRPISDCGITQRDQLRVMDAFRVGTYNTLVSTCVGEEGLDVGQVDLIICFDAFKSPIRLVQRLGRTGRRRLGRIVMLLTEGREEKNYAVGMARTSAINKALLDGGAYRKLAFYPQNPRMVPLGTHPNVSFSELNEFAATNNLAENSSTKPKKSRPSRSSKNAALLSHVDSIGLDNIPIRFCSFRYCKLVSQTHSVDQITDSPCFTERYNVTQPDRLRATRNILQSRLNARNNRGSSCSSHHLIAALRLIELHRRKLTQLSFYALGLRSIDINTPMTELVGDETNEPSQTIVNTIPHEEKLIPLESKYKATDSHSSITLPNLCIGLVSDGLFFSARSSSLPANIMHTVDDFTERLSEAHAPITVEDLQQTWAELIKPHQEPLIHQNTHVLKSDSPVKVHSVVVPKLSEDSKVVVRSKEDLNSLQSTSVTTGSGLADAFRLSTPQLWNKCVAQSTPQMQRSLPNTTQLNLSDALALLDRSSVQLDVSSLFDDHADMVNDTKLSNTDHTKHECSAIFSGLKLPTSFNTSNFNTKLTTEFDDLLTPTQLQPRLHNDLQHSSPRGNTDSFIFSSQINWSPVPINGSCDSDEASQPICDTKNHFILSQADVDQSVEEESSDRSYDSSFIDDKSHIERSNLSTLESSSMIGVYLRSIRSPSSRLIGSTYSNKHGKLRRYKPMQSSPRNLGRNDIFSQIPDQDDDYELDSFCVETPSSEHANIDETKPKRRCRILSSDSE